MTEQPTNTGSAHPAAAHRGGSRKLRWGVLIVLIAIAGVAAGTIWHDTFANLFSKKAEVGDGSLWTCSMHPQVIRDKPGVCPICHMALTPLKVDKNDPDKSLQHSRDMAATGQPDAAGKKDMSTDRAGGSQRKIKYWWDPMLSPPYISDKPGKSPMGMDLIPVYEDEVAAGNSVTIDPAVVQNMGVRVAKVTAGPLRRSIRAVGYLDEAEPNIHEINLRVSGWIEKLYADTEGMHLQQGDPLFDLYSPELRVAVEEMIAARRARGSMPSDADKIARQTSDTLYEASARKLELWGLDRRQIDALAKLDQAPKNLTFTSPITGHVTEKHIVAGAAVKAGDRVLRIVDHSMLWLDVQVFEQHLPFIKMGQKVTATIASQPGEGLEGKVIFIHPHVDPGTRTAMVRVALPNAALTLRPGMYATVKIEALLDERSVLVPREAVIDTGDRQIAFVTRQVGRFEPRLVKTGLSADGGMVQVLEGLAPGETVVTSGQFLLDSESRLREAIQKFLNKEQQVSTPAADPSPPPAVPAPTDQAKWLNQVDRVISTYLKLSTYLGGPQKTSAPVDPADLIAAAQALQSALADTPHHALAGDIAQSAKAIKDTPIDKQRKLFPRLSDAVIVLADRLPPSPAVANQLFVMECTMVKGAHGDGGRWLQTSEAIANPYFANTMKECGEVLRTIRTVAAPPTASVSPAPTVPQE